GGPLLLLAGALVAPLVARSRAVAAAAVATGLSILLWMNAPFTGVLSARAFDVGTGDSTRYLLPGVAAAVLTVALASRRGGTVRALALALLAAALVVGLRDTFALGFPSAPSLRTPVAGALVGLAAVFGVRRTGVPAVPWAPLAAGSLGARVRGGAAGPNGVGTSRGSVAC